MAQTMTDPYAILGIPRDASQRTALEAYRRLAKQFHPDLAADPSAGERMRRINAAWHVLSSPSRRARYDSASASRPSFDGRSRPFRPSPGVSGYQWTEPPRPEVLSDTWSIGRVILGVVGATLLLFAITVGFVPPLLVIVLVLWVTRIFRSFE